MGLDIIEFVMGVEEAVGVRIPDSIAANITTPRLLIDYLLGQLPQGRESVCLSQRAFYRVRRALSERIGLPPASLRPDTQLLAILPPPNTQAVWAGVGESLGFSQWPRARGTGWLDRFFQSSRPQTLGEVARHIAGVTPAALKPAGEGWTWGGVAAVVDWQLQYHFAIREYSLDDRFVEDMGME